MASTGLRIGPASPSVAGFAGLTCEARAEGFQFLDRLQTEWDAGTNRFDRAGEVLFGGFDGGDLVALGGLNIDPFAEDLSLGRLRRFYVAPGCRRRGVGAFLLKRLVDHARCDFTTLRLRAPDDRAGRFYEAAGFTRIDDPNATHMMRL